jgi:hypothetical protein
MRKALVLFTAFVILFAIVGCAPSATPTPVPPTPDAKATEAQITHNVFATLTASVPTTTNTPTNTATPTMTNTPTNTATPTITPTPTKTNTPTATYTPSPTYTPTSRPTPVLQDQTIPLGIKWQVTFISARRDKTIYGPFGAETAMGTWATLMFRVKNLQTGSDYLNKKL